MKERFREGQKVCGMLTSPGNKPAVSKPVEVQARVEYYFEECELLVPHTFDPTAEESRN